MLYNTDSGAAKFMAEENKNRTVKDSVFVDLFGRDITARENFISLYNALQGRT